jgi:hypothetical protein
VISVGTVFVDMEDVSCKFILEWNGLKLNKAVNSQNTAIDLRWCIRQSMMDVMKYKFQASNEVTEAPACSSCEVKMRTRDSLASSSSDRSLTCNKRKGNHYELFH